MNNCPNCGKIAGLHSSILQGCMCQYSMQAMKEGKDFTISKPWVGLTDEEKILMSGYDLQYAALIGVVERALKEKNT